MITKRPRRKRRDRSLRSLDPSHFISEPGLAITSVQHQVDGLRINFASNVTWNGSDVPGAFRADTSDGPMDGCINVLATGSNWITVEFNGSVSLGAKWMVDGPMAGITPAIAWPQSGSVTA